MRKTSFIKRQPFQASIVNSWSGAKLFLRNKRRELGAPGLTYSRRRARGANPYYTFRPRVRHHFNVSNFVDSEAVRLHTGSDSQKLKPRPVVVSELYPRGTGRELSADHD
ncbi:hypothetical protein EVAR_89827_1 [Eumeta japonica]|uniref:Uncharacterized protein n=1 Tax=Eumeta variegata TaxID=151549 RepID=A0A4C1YLB6_EUMVA|nr:hypothetical protein EVAR_89827_1 [Eumeta japonica]